MNIALDMDDTIVGLLDAWLCWLNDKYGFSYNKSWLKCDILVDDNNMNLKYFKGIRVLIDAPYNKHADSESYDYRISNLKELLEIISSK